MELIDQNIILREYKSIDWERVHLYASIPEFSQYDAWGPNTEDQTKGFIDTMLEQQKENPRFKFDFAIIDSESGLLIGGCGIRRETQDSSIANIGFAVNPDFQGRGFATNATNLLLKFGFEDLNLSVVYATCDAENIASYSVMKKCNMIQVGFSKAKRKFKNKVRDEFRYEITRDEYLKNKSLI